MNLCGIASENAGNATWSPEYRVQCEARLLLAMPLAQRRMELAVPARAGRRQALEAEMKRLWDQGRMAA